MALIPFVPAKAGTQDKELDSRLRGNERKNGEVVQSGELLPIDPHHTAFVDRQRKAAFF